MFKSFQDTSALQQFHGFPNLNMQQATSAYGFSGVTFWLDAAYGLNTQTNLGAVSSWQARVGGATFVQATAGNQPRLILNDANYNNLPSVEAQDNARFMDTVLGSGLKMSVPNVTVAVVSKINTASQRNAVMSLSTSAGTGIFDGGTRGGYNGFGWYVNDPAVLIGTTETLTTRIKIVSGTNVIVNGVNETTGNAGSVQTELNRLFRFDASGSNLIGSIAEIIAFGYSMTSDEAIALSNNLNQKYAIY